MFRRMHLLADKVTAKEAAISTFFKAHVDRMLITFSMSDASSRDMMLRAVLMESMYTTTAAD